MWTFHSDVDFPAYQAGLDSDTQLSFWSNPAPLATADLQQAAHDKDIDHCQGVMALRY